MIKRLLALTLLSGCLSEQTPVRFPLKNGPLFVDTIELTTEQRYLVQAVAYRISDEAGLPVFSIEPSTDSPIAVHVLVHGASCDLGGRIASAAWFHDFSGDAEICINFAGSFPLDLAIAHELLHCLNIGHEAEIQSIMHNPPSTSLFTPAVLNHIRGLAGPQIKMHLHE